MRQLTGLHTKTKTALITGSSGFVGSNLVKRLIRAGVVVTPLDHKILLIPEDLTAFLKNKHFDYIFHLATYGNLYSQEEEIATIAVNIIGTYNLLKYTQHIGYEAFINFSSSSVLLPVGTFYSATKLSAEHICRVFAQKHKKPIVSVRPSTVYGPRDNLAHLIPQVIHNITYGTPMTIVVPPKHDYIYIEDLLDGVGGVVEHAIDLLGESINISSGRQYTNGEVIKEIEKLMDKKLIIKEVVNMRSYDTIDWKVDNVKLKNLGWKPLTNLTQGLTDTIEYEKERPKDIYN